MWFPFHSKTSKSCLNFISTFSPYLSLDPTWDFRVLIKVISDHILPKPVTVLHLPNSQIRSSSWHGYSTLQSSVTPDSSLVFFLLHRLLLTMCQTPTQQCPRALMGPLATLLRWALRSRFSIPAICRWLLHLNLHLQTGNSNCLAYMSTQMSNRQPLQMSFITEMACHISSCLEQNPRWHSSFSSSLEWFHLQHKSWIWPLLTNPLLHTNLSHHHLLPGLL